MAVVLRASVEDEISGEAIPAAYNAERTSAADIARAAGACSAYLRDAPNFAVTEIVVLVAESMERMRA